MNSYRRVAKNLIFLSASEIVAKLIIFFIFVIIANYLGAELFGRFSFGYAFAMLAVVFVDLGLHYLNVIEIARDKGAAGKFLYNSFLIKTPFFIITSFLILLVLYLLDYSYDKIAVIFFLCVYSFIKSYSELSFAVFRAFEKMEYDAILKIIRNIVFIAIIIAVINLKGGLIALAIVFPIVELFIFIASLILVYTKFIRPSFSFDWHFIKNIFIKALPFSGSMLIGATYFYIGSIILSHLKGDTALGIFSASYNLVLGITFIPQIYTAALFPVLSRMYNKAEHSIIFIYKKSFKYLWIIGLPITIGSFVLAQDIIGLFYREGYHDSAIVIQILSVFILLKFINYLMAAVLSTSEKQAKRLLSMSVTVVISIVLSVILIPFYSFKGAAFAVIITEFVLTMMYMFYVSEYLGFYNFIPMTIKPIIAAAAMAITLSLLRLNLALEIIIGAAIYFLVLFALKGFDQSDKEVFQKVIRS